MNTRRKTLILGIGNTLLQDEGAGVHAIRMLEQQAVQRDDIELMDGGTLSFLLAGAIEDAEQLIVIDAAQYDGEPGTTKVFVGEQMDAFIGGNRKLQRARSEPDRPDDDRAPCRSASSTARTDRHPAAYHRLGRNALAAGCRRDPLGLRSGHATRSRVAVMKLPSNNLKDIPVKIDDAEEYSVGNIRALQAEIAARLEKLAETGETGMIDLNSLPLAPGEYEQLRQTLGQGEVSARIEAIGPSEIIETRYPGVWWVTHYNVEGDIVADLIEISWIPEIIRSQTEDIRTGLELLRAQLKDALLNNEVQQ